jgi:hypothetical protein
MDETATTRKAENYLGLIQLACALLLYRRLHRLTELQIA